MAWFVLDIVFKQGIGVSFKLYPDLKKKNPNSYPVFYQWFFFLTKYRKYNVTANLGSYIGLMVMLFLNLHTNLKSWRNEQRKQS